MMKGADLYPKDQSIQLFTDASNEGWCAHLEQTSTKGLWSDREKRLHVNVLELKAVSQALQRLKDQCRNKTVLVATDNSTVVAYINKQGGTHSAEMCILLWKIMTWCHHYQITLKARHIPGYLNVMSSQPSVQVESSPVNRMVTASAGVQTDLSQVNHSSCRSICYSSEPQSSTVRISSPRPKCLGHRCSEHKLVRSHCLCLPSHGSPSQVIQKIRQSSCLIIVIAPGWPGMPWFWDLVQLSTEIPLQLPVSTTLLKQSHNYMFHSNPQQPNLHLLRCEVTLLWYTLSTGIQSILNVYFLGHWPDTCGLLRKHSVRHGKLVAYKSYI